MECISHNELLDKLGQAVKVWLTRKAVYETINEECKPVFDKIASRFKTPDGNAASMDSMYLISDEDAIHYFKLKEQWLELSRYSVPQGYCPILMSDYEITKCEWDLLEAMDKMMGTGTAFHDSYGEKRERAVDLCVKGCVSHPEFEKPTVEDLRAEMSRYLKKEEDL